jgi:hypothetical protein
MVISFSVLGSSIGESSGAGRAIRAGMVRGTTSAPGLAPRQELSTEAFEPVLAAGAQDRTIAGEY